MEFLKDALGDLYQQAADRLAEYNEKNPNRTILPIDAASGNYVERERLDRLQSEFDSFKAENQAEALRQQLDELREKYSSDTEGLKKKIAEAAFNNAIDLELVKNGAKSVKALRALIDTDGLRLENGVVLGLKEQLSELRRENDYLFSQSGLSTGMSQGIQEKPEALSDEEYFRRVFGK